MESTKMDCSRGPHLSTRMGADNAVGQREKFVPVPVMYSDKQCSKFERSSNKSTKSSPNVRCKPLALRALVNGLSETQKEWVKELGFGELLRLPEITLNRQLCYWLCERFNTEKVCIELPRGVTIRIVANHVGWVLGIPIGGSAPSRSRERKVREELVKRIMGEYKGCKAVVEAEVTKKIKASTRKEIFQQHFLLYILGVLLCPTQCTRFSFYLLEVIADIEAAIQFNWAEFVLPWLVKSIQQFKEALKKMGKASGLGGCVLFMKAEL